MPYWSRRDVGIVKRGNVLDPKSQAARRNVYMHNCIRVVTCPENDLSIRTATAGAVPEWSVLEARRGCDQLEGNP